MSDQTHQLNPIDWVDKYSDRLFHYAVSRVRNEAVAQDLIQDTFLSALKNKAQFQGKSSEYTWLTAILKNKIFDYLKKSYRESDEFNEELYCEKEEVSMLDGHWKGHWIWDRGPKEWQINPEKSLESKEFYDILNRCIDELPPRFGVIFIFKELEQYSTKEVCKDLQLSESNLWVILHRIRKQLRRCLEIRWLNDQPYDMRK